MNKVSEKLTLVDCRYKDIGHDAFYEIGKLFNEKHKKVNDLGIEIDVEINKIIDTKYKQINHDWLNENINLVKLDFYDVSQYEMKIKNVLMSIAPTQENLDNLNDSTIEVLICTVVNDLYLRLTELKLIPTMINHNQIVKLNQSLIGEAATFELTNYETIKGLYYDILNSAANIVVHISRFDSIGILVDNTPVFESIFEQKIFNMYQIEDNKLVDYIIEVENSID